MWLKGEYREEMIKQAVILVAGRGSRMANNANDPKIKEHPKAAPRGWGGTDDREQDKEASRKRR